MHFSLPFLTGIFMCLGAVAPAFAAEKAEGAVATPPVMLGQVFLGLVIVIGMILLMAWLLKRLGHGGSAQGRAMRVVAALPLGTREKALLVQVGDKHLMLGVAPGRVNCLHVFDEPVVPPSEPGGPAAGGDFGSRFKEILAQRLGRS